MFQIAGITFHWYGLILGLAIGVGWLTLMYQAKRHQVATEFLEDSMIWILLGGLVGARLYHVATDWPDYQRQVINIFFIWRGGLSIIGAVMGGLLVLWWLVKRQPTQQRWLGTYLDLSVFVLPISQALGRVGNWVNQELYGLPTNLPWKIYIDPDHRLPGYQNIAYYHPLFAYEAIALLIFAAYVWWSDHQKIRRLGSGKLFAMYIAYYAVVRFGLDFLRLDAARLPGVWISINQLVMLVLLIVSTGFLWRGRSRYENI